MIHMAKAKKSKSLLNAASYGFLKDYINNSTPNRI